MSSELRQRKTVSKASSAPQAPEDASKKTPMEIAQEKYRKFFTRTIWGSLMIAVFGTILYSDHVLVSLFVVLLQIIVFKEMISLRYIEAKEKNLWGFRTLHWYFLFVTFYWLYGSSTLLQLSQVLRLGLLDSLSRSHLASAFAFYVIGFIAFIMTLQKDLYKYQFGQLTWTLMTLLIVIGQSHFIIQNIFKGLFWLLLPASLIICNDIMAYFCGLLLGRKFIDRPLTSLSPNKTWEGFIGAFICTCIFSFFFAYFLSQFEWFICPKVFTSQMVLFEPLHCTPSKMFVPQTYELPSIVAEVINRVGIHQTKFELIPVQFHALVFALFASLIAPFGGFFASGIKRAYGIKVCELQQLLSTIKDFDSLFPGHGGMTDRMDCQFIMGMFTYVYCKVFIASAMMDASHILEVISHLPIEDQWVIFKQLNNTLMEAI